MEEGWDGVVHLRAGSEMERGRDDPLHWLVSVTGALGAVGGEGGHLRAGSEVERGRHDPLYWLVSVAGGGGSGGSPADRIRSGMWT